MTQALWKCGRQSVSDRRTGTRMIGCNYWNVYISRKRSNKTVYDPYAGVGHRSKTSPYSRAQKGSGFGPHRPRPVDTVCRHCNARARFQLSRKRGDGRGRPRRVTVTLEGVHPDDLGDVVHHPHLGAVDFKLTSLDLFTIAELIQTAEWLNSREHEDRTQIGFVPAKIYRKV